MKILIIDDDSNIQSIWTTVLKSSGHIVVTAMNGRDGIAKTASEMPDLILLDQILPDMLGNEVLSAIKSNPQTQKISVAILSNYSEEILVKEALRQGAVDYILKFNIDPEDLTNRVNMLIRDLDSARKV